MAEDIVPGLLDAIQKDFQASIKKDKTMARIQKLVKDGSSSYMLANEYALQSGKILAGIYQKHLSSGILPDGKMYYNIADRVLRPTLGDNHDLIASAAAEVQTNLNKAMGIGLKGIKPEVNQDKIEGLINKISSAEKFDDVAWTLDEPVVNFSQSVVDDTVKTNAEFHAKSGLSPQIIRKSNGKCCDWCNEVVGTYQYPNVPDNVYRRHRYCQCTVEYDPGSGKRQDVWKKSWSEVSSQKQAEELRAIAEAKAAIQLLDRAKAKKFSIGSAVNDYFFKDQGYLDWKSQLTDDEFKSLQEYTSSNYKSINSYNRKNFNWAPDGPHGSVIDQAEEFMKNPPDVEPQRPDESFFAYKRRVNAVIPAEYSNAISSKKLAIENSEKLDEIIKKFELKDDLRTFRAIEPDALPPFNNLEDLIGKPYSDPSFMSTAPSLDSRAVNKDYVMEIYVPKGSGRGAYLEEFTAVNREYEFLLPRNSKFRIFDVRKESGKNIVMMEMIP